MTIPKSRRNVIGIEYRIGTLLWCITTLSCLSRNVLRLFHHLANLPRVYYALNRCITETKLFEDTLFNKRRTKMKRAQNRRNVSFLSWRRRIIRAGSSFYSRKLSKNSRKWSFYLVLLFSFIIAVNVIILLDYHCKLNYLDEFTTRDFVFQSVSSIYEWKNCCNLWIAFRDDVDCQSSFKVIVISCATQ